MPGAETLGRHSAGRICAGVGFERQQDCPHLIRIVNAASRSATRAYPWVEVRRDLGPIGNAGRFMHGCCRASA